MGSTNRELVIALRTDATGVPGGFTEANAQTAAFVAQQEKYAQAYAAVWGKARDPQAAKADGAYIREEMAARNEHASTFRLKQQIDQQYYSATLSRRELDLRNSQVYHDRLAQQHKDRVALMEKEDRDYAAWQQSSGGGMGQGWMMRMAGREIGQDIGNMIAPGLGSQLGAVGYFGGGAMLGVAAAVAAGGFAVEQANNIRDGIRQAREEQIAFNAEIDKSNAKWEMLAEKTVKFSQFGEQARSRFEQAQSAAIDASASVANAQSQYDQDWTDDRVDRAKLEGERRKQLFSEGAQFISGIDLYGSGYEPAGYGQSFLNSRP